MVDKGTWLKRRSKKRSKKTNTQSIVGRIWISNHANNKDILQWFTSVKFSTKSYLRNKSYKYKNIYYKYKKGSYNLKKVMQNKIKNKNHFWKAFTPRLVLESSAFMPGRSLPPSNSRYTTAGGAIGPLKKILSVETPVLNGLISANWKVQGSQELLNIKMPFIVKQPTMLCNLALLHHIYAVLWL